MMRMRFHVAVSLAALAFGAAAPAHAQQQARIDDIQVSREGETVSILVKLSQQPSAASAKVIGNDLVIDVDGISISQLKLDPPAGSLVRHVEAADRKVILSGAAFGESSTVIYRNAVLIETKLAEPALRGSSLMAAAPVKAIAPTPIASEPAKPIVVDMPPRSQPQTQSTLESRSAVATAPFVSAKHLSTASLAKIDAARCTAAASDLGKDPWALAALGDHALCLIDSGKEGEAKNKLDQLAAFAPEDWRVALGRAALAAEKGDASAAETGFRTAAMLAPDASVRAAITTRADQAAGR